MKKYYLHDGTNQHGPYSLAELKKMYVRPEAMVWCESLDTWTPAGNVAELDELFTAAQPVKPSFTSPFEPAPPAYQPKNKNTFPKKSIIIISAVLFAVALFSVIYFTNNKSEAADNVDTTSVEYQKKLAEIAQKEKERLAALEAIEKQQRNYRNNWKKYVSHRTNNFSVGTFGGINNLKVFATNNTKKLLDEVVVTVDYYKANGDILTSKEITLNNIQPGSIASKDVDDTWRGSSIKTRISRITSKTLEFCYNEEYSSSTGISGDKKDPWLCK